MRDIDLCDRDLRLEVPWMVGKLELDQKTGSSASICPDGGGL